MAYVPVAYVGSGFIIKLLFVMLQKKFVYAQCSSIEPMEKRMFKITSDLKDNEPKTPEYHVNFLKKKKKNFYSL